MDERNEPLERLQWVRKQTGLNAKEFAESVGMTAPGFHNMIARSSRVTRVLANSVELVHGYRAEWILTGEGLRKTEMKEMTYSIQVTREAIVAVDLKIDSADSPDELKKRAMTAALDVDHSRWYVLEHEYHKDKMEVYFLHK